MELEEHTSSGNLMPSAPVPIISKRKRGRPRKVPNIAMNNMIAESALNEIRGALGMERLADPPVVSIEPIDELIDEPILPIEIIGGDPVTSTNDSTTTIPVKRGRGRPRKHPHPQPKSGEPMVKRGRGRPKKIFVPILSALPVTELILSSDNADSIEPESNIPEIIPHVILVPSPELITQPTSQDATQIPTLTDNKDKSPIEIVAPAVPASVSNLPLPSMEGMNMTIPSIMGLEVPVKRKRGRPRKYPLPSSPKEKRGRGRPRKHPLPTSPKEKRGPGRPRKNTLPIFETDPVEINPPVKRGRGRPRKNPQPLSILSMQPEQLPLSSEQLPPSLESVNQVVSVSAKEPPSSSKPLKSTLTLPDSAKQPLLSPESVKDTPPLSSHVSLPELPKQTPVQSPGHQVKRGRGRPRKHPLPETPVEHPLTETPMKHPLPETPVEKRPRGRPRKHPKPEEPVIKRKRGRPRKNPITEDSTEMPKTGGDSQSSEVVVKRKRGRPRKDASAASTPITAPSSIVTVPPLLIPAQSSEPVELVDPIPAISPETSLIDEPPPALINVSSDTSKPSNEGFQLMLSSSDSDGPEVSNVAHAIATLNNSSKEDSPLLDDRFIESSDEDD